MRLKLFKFSMIGILSLALIFPTTPQVRANGSFDPQLVAAAEQAFLDSLYERLKITHSLNLSRIRQVVRCLQGFEEPTLCQEPLEIIESNILIHYSTLRRLEILSSIFSDGNMVRIFRAHNQTAQRLLRNAKAEPVYFDLKFTNPLISLNSLLQKLQLDDLPQVPFSSQEILSALDQGVGVQGGFNGHLREACQIQRPHLASLCAQIQLRYSPEKAKFFVETIRIDQNTPGHLFQLRPFWRAEVMDTDGTNLYPFKDKHRELKEIYSELAQRNPYVILVRSARPSPEDLLNAFSIMEEKASQGSQDFEAQYRRVKSGQASRAEALKAMHYGPIVQSLLEQPSRAMLAFPDQIWEQAVVPRLQSEFLKKELARLGLTIGGIVAGSIAACWLPQSRLARVAMNLKNLPQAFKPLCWSIAAGATNFWFLYFLSMEEYKDLYRDIFSTMDDENYLREIEDLSMAELMVLIDFILLPLGTGVVMGLIRKSQLALSPTTLHHLERSMRQWRPQFLRTQGVQ